MQGESKTVSTEEKQAGIKSQMRSHEYLHTRYHKELQATEYRKYTIERRNCTIKERFGIEIRDNI